MTKVTRTEPTNGPVRTCIGCRRRSDPRALVRVTRSGGIVQLDGPSRGRGAWLCRGGVDSIVAPPCLDAAFARRGFERAWRGRLSAHERSEIVRLGLGRGDGDVRPDGR